MTSLNDVENSGGEDSCLLSNLKGNWTPRKLDQHIPERGSQTAGSPVQSKDGRALQAEQAERVQQYWTSFARFGDPNGGELTDTDAEWTAFDLQHNSTLRLATPLSNLESLKQEYCNFWDRISPIISTK